MSKLTSELDNIEKNKRPISKWTPEQLKYFEYLENIVNAIPKRYGTHYVTPSVSSYDIKESNDLDNLQEMVNAIPKGYSITVPENESKSNTFLSSLPYVGSLSNASPIPRLVAALRPEAMEASVSTGRPLGYFVSKACFAAVLAGPATSLFIAASSASY